VSDQLKASQRLIVIVLVVAALIIGVTIVISRATGSPPPGAASTPIANAAIPRVVAAHALPATELRHYAAVTSVRRGPVLVLGPASEMATMLKVATAMRAAVPRVTAVWGPHWARRVVVQVPSTQRELGLLTGDRGDLSRIAALTTAEVSATRGRPKPVGDRVTINPRVWPTLSRVGAAIVLTHELTHVASRADTGSQTPRWLAEGFADYVGFRGEGLPVTSAAAELARAVRAGHLPSRLPADVDFSSNARGLARSYELSWLACRDIARRYGQPALVRFYRTVGTSHRATAQAVAVALHRVLGLTPSQFTVQWRAYVRAQLAG
jgi:hypothetical protein